MDNYQHHQRAPCPRKSHGSVDRQPNDRLGRNRRRQQLFQHRRAILRGYTNSDTHANTYSDGYSYSYSNRNRDRDIHADANSYGNGDSYGNSYIYPDANGYGHSHSYAHTDAYGYSDSNGNSNSDLNAYSNCGEAFADA